jgi:hypothetical protein
MRKGWTMISRDGASECYVYIVPPGETSFVTAGRFALETDRHGVTKGKFVYGRPHVLQRADLELPMTVSGFR